MIYVTLQIENCSKFWFQPKSELPKIKQFYRELNENEASSQIIEPCTDYVAVIEAKNIVARNYNDGKLYRARLISWDYGLVNKLTRVFKANVCFIDFGHTQMCQMKDLHTFIDKKAIEQQTLPARCFPCKLAAIQPSMANISGGNMWDRGSVDTFASYVMKREVTAEVSVEHFNMLCYLLLLINFIKNSHFFADLLDGKWNC